MHENARNNHMVTVIICTYNRAESLKVTLSDLGGLTPPAEHSVEILVVDNNSADATEETVRGYEGRVPFPIRYVCETSQGLSYARNRGILEANGEWIVFTDDDVRIDSQWLSVLMSSLAKGDAVAAGGRVLPIWPDRLPRWIATEGPFVQHGVFLNYTLGSRCRLLHEGDPEPFGCNMAFHSSAFHEYGLFRTDLGRTGKRLLAGEDTEMFARLRKGGAKVLFVPDAVVNHPVEAQRLSLGYLFRWKYWAGYSAAVSTASPGRRGIPRYLNRQLATNCWQGLKFGVRGNLVGMVHHIGLVCAGLGAMRGSMEESATSTTTPAKAITTN